MPPGTGDIQLSLAQSMNISAAVIVTTPQKLSFVDVVKGIDMLDTVNVPCVAVVENMAEYQTYEFNELFYTELGQKIETLPKNTDKTSVASILREAVQAQRKSRRIFGEGHAARLKEMWGIETVISLPVLEEVSKCGDSGAPFVLEHPNSAFTLSMNNLAARVRQEIENLADSQYKYTLYFNHRTAMVSLESDKQKATGKEISAFDLRCACRCAACIEELTGRALLEPDKVSLLVQPIIPAPQPRNIHNQLVNKFAVGVPIGRYAVAIDWSDGHKSLFPYKQLRLLTKQQSIQETSMHVDASI